MKAWFKSLVPVRLWTTKCQGCDDIEPHSAHLSRIGKWVLR